MNTPSLHSNTAEIHQTAASFASYCYYAMTPHRLAPTPQPGRTQTPSALSLAFSNRFAGSVCRASPFPSVVSGVRLGLASPESRPPELLVLPRPPLTVRCPECLVLTLVLLSKDCSWGVAVGVRAPRVRRRRLVSSDGGAASFCAKPLSFCGFAALQFTPHVSLPDHISSSR